MPLRALLALIVCLGGCATYAPPRAPHIPNPVAVPACNYDYLWDQIVDIVDDSFDVTSEQRVRPAGDVLTVGRIDTAPTTGATLLEPWRSDAADGYERLHGTLQTVRRRAVVQVVPLGDVFQVEVTVFKELENLGVAEYSTAGSATFRNDDSLIRIDEPVGSQPISTGWLPLGRDVAMEQRMLQQISMRLGSVAVPTAGHGAMPSMVPVPSGALPAGQLPPGAEMVPSSPGAPVVIPGERLPPGAVPQ